MKHFRSYLLLALFGLLICCSHKPAVHQQSETWRTCSGACVQNGASAHMVVEDETKTQRAGCTCKWWKHPCRAPAQNKHPPNTQRRLQVDE